MKKVLFVFGTRPEAIKMAPIILEMKKSKELEPIVCSTGQHKEMLYQVFDFFNIKPDYELAVMKPGQDLFDITASILIKLRVVLDEVSPDFVVVQGDTTSALVGALGAFYKQIKIAHVEAGLRSWDMYSPFPEEANRVLISRITDIHFAPTKTAEDALIKEGVDANKIHLVGNPVTDAILIAKDIVSKRSNEFEEHFKNLDETKKVILVTAHRRESFGQGMKNICEAIKEIASQEEVEFIFPVHLNPNVQSVVKSALSGLSNVHLYNPFDYPEMVWAMNRADIVLTDSGGVQEEAPSLGKPVLVLRDVTERMEGVEAGTAMLVGTDRELIVDKTRQLLNNNDNLYAKMAHAVNPYGDGECAKRMIEIFEKDS